ncbi:Methyltransferase domain-containing protein [Singulisphaera sp. GP187]|uniref:class I SAM-dependent methyltransferase n=1 Tax=Singulisphaera sp. GP187 TaxID=1882752 RepID=UPI0009283719|nr:class I SAM-dependent methyltransferase [Singulisphaera sp. GP187]SIO46831.1 Methyltransferase domain-containing protein [Singulisphaera sp. GP187]
MTDRNRSLDRYYATRFVFDERREVVWGEICRLLQARFIAPRDVIIEIGAGYCHFINQIQGCEKHAFDLFPGLPDYARPNVVTHVQSCVSLHPLQEESVDTVFSSNLFEHLSREDLHMTLLEAWRVLRRGGRLIVLQPNFRLCYRHYFDDYTHLQIFSDCGLSDLLSSYGFHLLEVRPRFLPFSMKSWLPVSASLVRLYLRSPVKPFAGQMLLVVEKPPE